MAQNRRIRLASFLKREIASCLQAEARDPRLGFVTVTRVEISDDLSQATAYYTVLGNPSQIRTTGKALDSLRGFVQRSYAKELRMRIVPTLKFSYDEEERKRQYMDDLIAKARASDPDGEAEND